MQRFTHYFELALLSFFYCVCFLRELFSGTLSSERLEQAMNLPMKVARELFVCKCKLSLVKLYLADMPINKLKTTFNSFFTEWFQIQREFPCKR